MSATTTLPAKSAFASSRRPRVTEVAQVVTARALAAVCLAENTAALHFATDQGIVLVKVPRDSFCAIARARRDSNGNPFEPVGAEDRDVLAADAAETAARRAQQGRGRERVRPTATPVPEALIALPPLGPRQGKRSWSEGEIETLRTAWRAMLTDPAVRLAHVCRQLQLSTAVVLRWFDRFRSEPGAPVLKPSGRLA